MSEESINAMSKKRSMTNEELISLASSLFGQASIAQSYDAILKQYMQNLHEYTAEMECSCAFYSISFKALAEGLFIYLARLFDDDGKSLTLRNLLNELGKLSVDDMHPELRKMYFARGEKFRHMLKPIEEIHYPHEVHATKELFAANGIEYRNTTVDISLHDRIKLFRKRFKALKTPIYNLSQQRNKMLAHNDAETCFEYEKVTAEYYLNTPDIYSLVEYAVDLSRFACELLTNEAKTTVIINIDDWSTTLRLVRVGLEQMTRPIVLSGNDEPIDEPEG